MTNDDAFNLSITASNNYELTKHVRKILCPILFAFGYIRLLSNTYIHIPFDRKYIVEYIFA